MKFLIDINLKHNVIEQYIDALQDCGIDYILFSAFPKDNEIKGVEKDDTFFALSNISRIKLAKSKKPLHFVNQYQEEVVDNKKLDSSFKKAFFYDKPEMFKQSHAILNKSPMLNSDASFLQLPDNLNTVFNENLFIKPNDDLKWFIGGIIEKDQNIEDFVLNSSYMEGWKDTEILVSSLKSILYEYRFFVFNKEVITGSQYMERGKVSVSQGIPDNILKTAIEYAKIYQPDVAFTMDLCLLDTGEIKIVEYNCINASGTYESDLKLLFKSIYAYLS